MIHPATQERVRSAGAEVVAGDTHPLAFEDVIADMIAARVLTANDARNELEAAVRNGTLPPESLPRFCDQRVATQPFTAANNTGWTSRTVEDARRVRAFATSPANVAPQGEAADTGSVWIEPDAASTGQRAGVGTILGNRYRLDCKLGEGGMGVVYRATDMEVRGEAFAIKVLKPAIRRRPESLILMREEVRKTRALRHPNIVGVYSLNSDPAGVYMLMELLEGKTLSALISEQFSRGMPWMRAWPLIRDIGSALAYAHDQNVIHSDLKPSNLFVTISGKARLLDFGIARAARSQAARLDTGTLGACTPAYASVEMLEGNSPDQTDDVYSFACVIYEMLSGNHPFNSLSATDAQRVGLRAAPLASLTARQNRALNRALAFDRQQRTGTVEAFLAAMKHNRSRPRWPPLWVGTAAVAVCFAAAAFVWSTRSGLERAAAGAGRTSPFASNVEAAPVSSPTSKLGEGYIERAPVRAVLGPTTEAAPVVPTASSPMPIIAVSTAASAVAEPIGAAADEMLKAKVLAVSGSVESPERSMVVSETAPIGKRWPSIVPLLESKAKLDACPYPDEARRQAETGTVALLVHVSPSGAVSSTRVESSSGSESLDRGSQSCVEQFARFAPVPAGESVAGYWGRIKMNWFVEN